uniref:Pyrroline-5-carboxylate reductase n=1 Tax=Roseihalotalea indica TaxID=2867963 RepID=A0AA49JIQ3_9BACT|nr:pyrroline-5-carboxylate reductase [Tunicatimonas sp. TK19036]
MKKRIAILGGGNLGKAIAIGLASTNQYEAGDITVTKRRMHSTDDLKAEGIRISTNNREAVEQSDLILLCVQPKQLEYLLVEIRDVLNPKRHVLVSTITGVSISDIAQLTLEDFPIIRAMPNTAIAIRESMTCIAAKNASEEVLSQVQEIFDVMGATLVIDEELMAAATVLGASGIAFCLRYIRAAAQGGIQMGFHAEEAQKIAVQVCRGAASLILQKKQHPEMEIDKVTTPQGCTIEGLNEMEHNGLSSAVIKGIVASHKRIANIKD